MNHRTVSFFKSALRLAGYSIIMIVTGSNLIFVTFLLLTLAEVLGIVEELVVAKAKA